MLEYLLIPAIVWLSSSAATGYVEALGGDAYNASKKVLRKFRNAVGSRKVIEGFNPDPQSAQFVAVRRALAQDPELYREMRELFAQVIQAPGPQWVVEQTVTDGSSGVTGATGDLDAAVSLVVRQIVRGSTNVTGIRVRGAADDA